MTYATVPNADAIKVFKAANAEFNKRERPYLLVAGDSLAGILAKEMDFSSFGYDADRVLNYGVGGTTIAESAWAFGPTATFAPDLRLGLVNRIVLWSGVNTIHGTTTVPSDALPHMLELRNNIGALCAPGASAVVLRIPYSSWGTNQQHYTGPQRVDDFNAYLSGSAVTNGYWKYADFGANDPSVVADFPDGVHPTPAWVEANVIPALSAVW